VASSSSNPHGEQELKRSKKKKTPRWHYYAIVHFILALFSILAIASAFQMIFNMECLTSEKKKAAVRRPQFYLVSIIKFHEYITMTD